MKEPAMTYTMTATTEADMDLPASQHPVLRQAVRDVLNTTVLKDALAGDQMRELIGDILDAGTSAFAIADVLIAASVQEDYADELARKIADAVLEAALNL
jgi:anthranilate phosphoribosyltransferase